MPVTIKCPFCDATAKFPEEHLGRKIRCKSCETVFVAEEVVEKLTPKPKSLPPKLPELPTRKPRIKDDAELNRMEKSRSAEPDEDEDEELEEERPRPKKKKKKRKKKSNVLLFVSIGMVTALMAIGGILYAIFGGNSNETKRVDVAQNTASQSPKTATATTPESNVNPAAPPAELKRYTISNARYTNSVGAVGHDFKGASGKSIIFDFQKNEQTQGLPNFMIVIILEDGEKLMFSGSGFGPPRTMAGFSGTAQFVIGTGGSSKGGPGGFGRPGGGGGGPPNLGRNPKMYLAVSAGGMANPQSEGERLSNIVDLKVE